MSPKENHTQLIKTEAKRLGFLSCGISKADFLEEEAPRLEKWLNNNMNGEMGYMANHLRQGERKFYQVYIQKKCCLQRLL